MTKINEIPWKSLKVGDRVKSDFKGKIGTISNLTLDSYEKLDILWDEGHYSNNIVHALLTTVNYGDA